MSIAIETPKGADALTEFIQFQDRVNAARGAYWPAIVEMTLPALLGEGPDAEGKTFHPVVAREGGEIVARALAVVDRHYLDHWKENVGHVALFEAMPGSREAVKLVMDEACEWLYAQGMRAARAGFGGTREMPFVVDDYDSLPPLIARHNPSYYHSLIKDAGFESEKGWVDYKIEVTDELKARYASSLDAARANGFEIVPLKDVPADRWLDDFVDTWNGAFKAHWGMTPFGKDEFRELREFLGPLGMDDTSVIAYRDGEPVGVLFVIPELTALAATTPERPIRPDERLNFLGIGVSESARGRGVNMAMASYAYLELIARGATHLSYTLVLDDNWPSRRTAEKLGARVCANYMVYRRNLGR